MNRTVTRIQNRLMRTLAKGALTKELLAIVLQEEDVQEKILDCAQGDEVTSEEEEWDLLQEAVRRRLNLAKKAANVGATKGGQPRLRVEGPVIGASGSGERTIEDLMFYVALYQDTFVGHKSEPGLKAASARFGWEADQDPSVVRFRNRALEDGVLDTGVARSLIGSYAARFFPLEWFTDWGIPIVGHTSTIVDGYDWGSHREDLDHRVTVRVDPPGVAERVRYAHPDAPIRDEDGSLLSTRCVMLKESGAVVPPYKVGLPEPPEDAQEPEDLVEAGRSPGIPEIGFEGGLVYVAPLTLAGSVQTPQRPAFVWPGSLIDDLYTVSAGLASSFPWIGKDAAAEFVLTGLPPDVGSLSAKLYSDGNGLSNGPWRIVLDSMAWVPAEDVLSAYKRLQCGIIGDRNKLPGSKTFEVACFVWEQDRLNGYERQPWRKLCEHWNAKEPDLRFDKWRSFRACFKRGEAAVEALSFGS